MPITLADVISAADRAESARQTQTTVERYADGQPLAPYAPQLAQKEAAQLTKRSTLNLIGVHVNSLTQDLAPVAYVPPGGEPSNEAWMARTKLGLGAITRQARRWAFIHGRSFVAIVPTTKGWVARAYEDAGVHTEWDDEINDMRPRSFIAPLSWGPGGRFSKGRRPTQMVSWDVDEGLRTWIRGNDARDGWVMESQSAIAMSLFGDEMPVVQYLSGEWSKRDGWQGEVAPLIDPQNRVTQTIFDMLLVQQFGAIVIRTMAGITLPDDDTAAEMAAIKIAANRFLVSEDPDTKFGALAGTPLNPFIDAVTAAIQHFGIVASISPTRFAGKIENVTAETISAARQPEEDARIEYRERWGEAEAHLTRLAMIAGDKGDPGEGGEIIWRETQARSLSQIADAAAKFITAHIPVRPLIARSLGWSRWEIDQIQEQMLAEQAATGDGVAALISDRQNRTRLALDSIASSRAAARP